MENEENILGADSAENNSGAESQPAEEFITDEEQGNWEDLGGQPEIGPEGEPTLEANKEADPATAEKSEEDKELEEQLKDVPQSGLVGHLRGLAKTALKTNKSLTAQVTELEGQLETERGVMFRPTVPAEDFESQGKAKAFWDDIATNHPAYYTPMVNDVIRAHLNPEKLIANPGMIPQAALEAIADHWVPQFIEREFGLDRAGFNALVQAHQSGTLNQGSSDSGQPTALSPQQIIEKFNLDAETDKDLIAHLTAQSQTNAEVARMRSQIEKLSQAHTGVTKQQQEAEAQQRVATFDSMITADRQQLLDTAMKSLPRNPDGSVHKDFAHLPGQIKDLVDAALARDGSYSAARDNGRKWFKQPGNPDTAKQLASGDLKKIYGHHKTIVTQIAQAALKPYEELIRAKNLVAQSQRTRIQIPGGTNPTSVTRQPAPQSRPGMSLAERAIARGRQ